MDLWTCFSSTHKVMIEDENRELIPTWITENIYYMGDLSKVNLAEDDRFKAVADMREQAIFVNVDYYTFPIKTNP